MLEIYKDFRFEASHWLPHVPEGHPCGRMHGHSYRCRVYVRGPLADPEGWVVDYAVITAAMAPVLRLLDHGCLNDVDGLSNPTSEVLAMWVHARLSSSVPGIAAVEIAETATCGCVYRPPQ